MANNHFNLYDFSITKTIKLLDTYSVEITLSEADHNLINPYLSDWPWKKTNGKFVYSLPNCTSITLPEFTLKTEEYKYGNNSKLMSYPDYEFPSDLKLEFMETIGGKNIYNDGQPVAIIQLFVNLFLSKLFDAKSFSYKLHDYIDQLQITVYKNDFSTEIAHYTFKELKLTNYTKYGLNYSSDDLCNWSLEFSYRSYDIDFYPSIPDNNLMPYKKIINNDKKSANAPIQNIQEQHTIDVISPNIDKTQSIDVSGILPTDAINTVMADTESNGNNTDINSINNSVDYQNNTTDDNTQIPVQNKMDGINPESETQENIIPADLYEKFSFKNMKREFAGLVNDGDETRAAGILYNNNGERIGIYESSYSINENGERIQGQVDIAVVNDGDNEYKIKYGEGGKITSIEKMTDEIEPPGQKDQSQQVNMVNNIQTSTNPPITNINPAQAIEYKPVGRGKDLNIAAKNALDQLRKSETGLSPIEKFEYTAENKPQVIELAANAMVTVNKNLSITDARQYAEKIFVEAEKHDVSFATVFSVTEQESNFNTNAKSNTGAGGLMQLTQIAIKDQAQRNNKTAIEMKDDSTMRYDPMKNIEVGVGILGALQDTYLTTKGKDPKLNSLEGQIGSYNAGSGGMNMFMKTGKWTSGQKEYTMMVKLRRNAFNEYMSANMKENKR